MLMQVWEVSSCGAYDCARLAIVGWRGMRAVGAGVLLAAAMARDLYVGKRPTLLLLTLMTVMVIAPQYGSGVIGLAPAGIFADGTPWPIGWGIAVAGLGSAACAWPIVPTPARRMKPAHRTRRDQP